MDKTAVEKVLAHYGIKGMRWGVRRKNPSGRKPSSDYSTSRKMLRGKKLSELSDADLKKLNSRLEMERKYSQLNPTASASGKRLVGQFMKQYSNLAVSAAAGAAITLTVGRLLEKGT